MQLTQNPYRGPSSSRAMDALDLADVPYPSTDAARPSALLSRCPRAEETPLLSVPSMATSADVDRVYIKDERDRMGMGSFKALGAAYVIARAGEVREARGRTYVTASAGNHGLSVAAGAAAFGARSVIYLAETVPEAFAERLRAIGAEVVRHGAIYEQSMAGAQEAADREGWALLSDSSWAGYFERPHTLMEGYLVLMAEAIEQMKDHGGAPSHIFLQAGVGGLAASCAALVREAWNDVPRVIVVEPDEAPALAASIAAGKAVTAPGRVSAMGRLDCKEPSLIALKGLARDADLFATISEDEGHAGARFCAEQGLPTTPSGAAGLSALLASSAHREALQLDASSRVLAILSEGPE